MTSDEIIQTAQLSITELRLHGREPTRIRVHPLDAETLIAARSPEHSSSALEMLLGIPVELDSAARLGEPVAEAFHDR
jgi:hypothetical protein